MTTTTPIAVREYLARVRTALADLPEGELDEVLDDVRPHLAEIAAELGEDARLAEMVERLGTPESYAAELRAAGGYPAPSATSDRETARRPRALLPRVAVWVLPVSTFAVFFTGAGVLPGHPQVPGLNALLLAFPALVWSVWYLSRRGLDVVAGLPEVRWIRRITDPASPGTRGAVMRYLRSLVPAWWLVCAVMLLLIAALLLREGSATLAVPGDALLLLVVLAGLVLFAGTRLAAERRWLWVALPVSALVAGTGLGLVGTVLDRGLGAHEFAYAEYPPDDGVLRRGSGMVSNIYAFDSDGKPVTGLFLYDQSGRPLDTPEYTCAGDGPTPAGSGNRYPHPRITVGGREAIDPEFGEPRYDPYFDDPHYDSAPGSAPECEESDEIPFSVAVPKDTESRESPVESSREPSEKPQVTSSPTPSKKPSR